MVGEASFHCAPDCIVVALSFERELQFYLGGALLFLVGGSGNQKMLVQLTKSLKCPVGMYVFFEIDTKI